MKKKLFTSIGNGVFNDIPDNEEETLKSCNALFGTGNYPIVTDGCFHVGISGGCGPDCYVYKNGECGEPDEMIDRIEGDELKQHYKLYKSTDAL